MLEVRAVSFRYPGGLLALDGVGLELNEGELVCVLGPNGSGKSTLLKVVGGLCEPAIGEVLLDGESVSSTGSRERARRIASVPQRIDTLPDLDVKSFVLGGRYPYLGFLGRAHPDDREAVETALAEADVGDLGGRLVTELSGGQMQRVLVARALAQRAPLLLFDEPTASLDPEHQVRLFQLIGELVGRGKSALVATHELNLSSRYADRILLMDGGRQVALGPPGEVLCKQVLEPVFGANLKYLAPDAESGGPLVLPWPEAPPG